ncbi:prolyl oligopeptidase family serine peptidase [Rubripirellula reticaptiva]|uniref:Prolyl tripeptidyl peptidase n=1 Tax=Rubripirellula reticaptiva TaxID=2528013 RepID=A0A5C6FDR2_9BACT|nr:prolyl oligopeptidase family serine peptidase [Rubripirellula reticaptiva]TWU58344.1 Prolyl tripeptidyl peptidase precursor [Rubripirellula reticaptiva]
MITRRPTLSNSLSLAIVLAVFFAPHLTYGQEKTPGRIFKDRVVPHWFDGGDRFWYRNELPKVESEYILVDAVSGTRQPAFDHNRLAKALQAKGVDADGKKLQVRAIEFDTPTNTFCFTIDQSRWECDRSTYQVTCITDESVADDTASVGVHPRDLPSRSRNTGPETEICFNNQTDHPVEIQWVRPDGERQSYGTVSPGKQRYQHTFSGHVWMAVDAEGHDLIGAVAEPLSKNVIIRDQQPPRRSRNKEARPRNTSNLSPDGRWQAAIENHNVFIREVDGNGQHQLSDDGEPRHQYDLLRWSPDSKTLIAFRVQPFPAKEVYRIESSPRGGGRAKLQSSGYALPGDPFDKYELNLFDIATAKQIKPTVPVVDFGRPQVRFRNDKRCLTFNKIDRGHQRFRVIEVDLDSGESRAIIDERSDTFIWTAHGPNIGVPLVSWMEQTNEIVYVSERDGWRHLYLIDAETGETKNQITKGDFVVRKVDCIDEATRQIWFQASGRNANQDPYLIHHYRVDFDGENLVALTEADGNHVVAYSPGRRFLIDSYSRVDAAPVHELRREDDGSLVCRLETADVSSLNTVTPEVFVAKGRDGKTDIWGIIWRPSDHDPNKRYPIIEDIYAGPHDSFVPKSFSVSNRYQELNDLGFIVVKIDGMGTANRSKAFHDVCWKNIKDGGFPDRIAWIKAAAQKDSSMDVSRVGIFGTSAGGQNAAAAVLLHSDFYRAAYAACGCHDNRMDKASWNEQWMGYPVGPHYAECSNIENAHALGGHLMLMVGELDSNVPPESTFRFADALIKADKNFDLLMMPGVGHSNGGKYGQRRMREFFVEHLNP